MREDSFRRPETVSAWVGPKASKNFTSCLRAAYSFQALSRLNISSSSSTAVSSLPVA